MSLLSGLLVAFVAPATMVSQVPIVSAAPVVVACQIHVWPATEFHTLTEGAVWNNVIDSAFTTRPGHTPERQVPRQGPLTPAGQRTLLAALDLPALLHSPGAQVVLYDRASTRRPAVAAVARQDESQAVCYVEVTVAKNFFNRSGLTANTLRTLFILDDFRDRQVPVRSFIAWSTTPLSLFPARRPEQTLAADAELAAAFQTNFRKFSEYAFAPPRRK